MKSTGTALYLFLCLCQITPTCYSLFDKDVYGSTVLSLVIGILVSFAPFVGQLFAAVGLSLMTDAPPILFLVPLMLALILCHAFGGIAGAWALLDSKKNK